LVIDGVVDGVVLDVSRFEGSSLLLCILSWRNHLHVPPIIVPLVKSTSLSLLGCATNHIMLMCNVALFFQFYTHCCHASNSVHKPTNARNRDIVEVCLYSTRWLTWKVVPFGCVL
jgi:hypothetical protein